MALFEFIVTPIDGVRLVQRRRIEDARGFLSRFYCADEFRAAGITKAVDQINLTLTRRKGAVRGMHFQHPPHA